MIFKGRNRVRYNYSRWGYTRGNGKVWHGGIDIEGMDDKTILMPSYKGKTISGRVTTARIVTNRSNRTWEWGYYVCVKLDNNQTPDNVNFLYFCHCKTLLVKVGDKVSTGDAIAIMGNTGNAALANPPYAHCHFEVRATATGKGLNPCDYCGFGNCVGIYVESESKTTSKLQTITISNISNGDAMRIYNLCKELDILDNYKSEYVR